MHTSYISTAALRGAPRNDILRLQSELTERTAEVASGRHADVGLALGTSAGHPVRDRMDLTLLETLKRSNGTASARLEITQTALGDLKDLASEMLGDLVALPNGPTAARTMVIEARSALDRLADRLNASDGGSYVFAGTNSDVQPFTRFGAGPEAAIATAFQARFGFAPGDPLAAGITAADMTDFLTNDFAPLFADPAWGTTWSSASDTNVLSRIAPSERVETGTNSNENAFRTLAEGLAMVGGLGIDALGEAARKAVVDVARLKMGNAVAEVVALQTKLGFAQQAIDKANTRMSLAADLLEGAIARAEEVDPAEAKTRIDLVTTQIEMSYALTNQLGRLSILKYA
jgi:flagellar hook-associated protein 3 FlgL